HLPVSTFFLSNDTTPTNTHTLSLHDALPILSADAVAAAPAPRPVPAPDGGRRYLVAKPRPRRCRAAHRHRQDLCRPAGHRARRPDRKSTRLNSSHQIISYAVFCLKKKKTKQ